MNLWKPTLETFGRDLASRPAIPPGVVRLLEVEADAAPSDIVQAINSDELGRMIHRLEEVSLQLGIEFATELRIRFEEVGAFEEAAAMDLVADRLKDELAAR